MRKSAPSQVRRLHDAEACNTVRHGYMALLSLFTGRPTQPHHSNAKAI